MRYNILTWKWATRVVELHFFRTTQITPRSFYFKSISRKSYYCIKACFFNVDVDTRMHQLNNTYFNPLKNDSFRFLKFVIRISYLKAKARFLFCTMLQQ